MFLELLIPAFVAGLLTFLAPCTLPIAPAYLGFIGGVSAKELNGSTAGSARRKIFLSGLLFVAGFSAVFILLGTLVGFLGSALVPYRLWLTRIGGAVVILFGLFLLGVFKLPFLAATRRINFPFIQNSHRLITPFLFGASFAFGWTPCVGPVLGTILLLASTTATALTGAALLLVFSIGLAIPFLAIALAIGAASNFISRVSKYLRLIEIVGGLFLILLGYLLFTDNFNILISYGYRLLRFINYGSLIDYL